MEKSKKTVRFQVHTAANLKLAIFLGVATCSLVEVYQLFKGSCCLPYQGDHLLKVSKSLLLDYLVQHQRTQSSSFWPP